MDSNRHCNNTCCVKIHHNAVTLDTNYARDFWCSMSEVPNHCDAFRYRDLKVQVGPEKLPNWYFRDDAPRLSDGLTDDSISF